MDKDVWREFYGGLTKPSIVSVAIAGAVVLVLATMVMVAFSQFSEIYPHFAKGARDTQVPLTVRILQLPESLPSGPKVIILGASAVRLGIVDDAKLTRRLQESGAHDIKVISLLSSAQSLWESIAILKRVASKAEGLVIMEINPLRLAQFDRDLARISSAPRLGFRSSFIDRQLAEAGLPVAPRFRWHVLDNWSFFLARVPLLVRNVLWRGPPTFAPRAVYRGTEPVSEAWMQNRATAIRADLAHYASGSEHYRTILRKELRNLPNLSKYQIVLLESPVNPRFIDEVAGRDFFERHWANMKKFAENEGLIYLRLASNEEVPAHEFRDWFHVFDAETVELSAELTKSILNIMESLPDRGAIN